MGILLAILLMACLGLGLDLVLYRRDIRRLREELDYIQTRGLKNRKLLGSGRRKDLGDLRDSINNLMAGSQRVAEDYRELEERNKEIIASISHDLRTPLTSIRGYTDLLSKRLEDEKSLAYIDIIRSRSENLGQLIDSFYEMARLEARDLNYDRAYLDLEELLMEGLAARYDSFVARGIVPEIIVEGEDFQILSNGQALERVISNLIDNALKYSGTRMKLELLREDGVLLTRFINDSRELNEDLVKKVFDKFFIVDSSRQSESTGLGLFITRELLESLGHRIEADYRDGEIIITIYWQD